MTGVAGERVRWGRVFAFFAVTVVATQGWSALIGILRGPARKGDLLEWGLRANLAMLVPGIVSLIFARFILRESVGNALDLHLRPNRWWVVAWILPAVMAFASVNLRLLAPAAHLVPLKGGLLSLSHPGAAVAVGLIAGATVCLPGAFGEELAWRGLLRHELAPKGFWYSSVIIGLLWSAWHLPAVVLGGFAGGSVAGALGLTLNLLLTTPIAIALCVRGMSVMPAVLFHASGSGMVAAGMMVKGGTGTLPVVAPYLPALLLVLLILAFPASTNHAEQLAPAVSDPD